jgi:hypothetical protein
MGKLKWIFSNAAVINVNVNFLYLLKAMMMMIMTTTMAMMIIIQEQITTQFFWDMWSCANGRSNSDVSGQRILIFRGRNYSSRTHRRLKMRTLRCFETSGFDHPLS